MNTNKTLYRSTRVVWYVVYVLELVLLLRFALKLFGANAGAAFTDIVYSISSIPLAPFRFVFDTKQVAGSVMEWSTLLAMLVYWLVGLAIVKFIVMNRPVDERDAEAELRAEDRS